MPVPPPAISRERAREIARARAEHVCIVPGPVRVGGVYSVEELKGRLPSIYGFGAEELEGLWIAYVERPTDFSLRSSVVVLVSKSTGEIAYAGSANDEG